MSTEIDRYYVVGLQVKDLLIKPENQFLYIQQQDDENVAYKFVDNTNELLEKDKFKRAFLAGRLLKEITPDTLHSVMDGCFSTIFEKDPVLGATLLTISEEELISRLKICEITTEKVFYTQTTISAVGRKGERSVLYTTQEPIIV